MQSRSEVTTKYATLYAKAPKKDKCRVLDQVVEVTGWTRDNASLQPVLEPGPDRSFLTPADDRNERAEEPSRSGHGDVPVPADSRAGCRRFEADLRLEGGNRSSWELMQAAQTWLCPLMLGNGSLISASPKVLPSRAYSMATCAPGTSPKKCTARSPSLTWRP